MSDTQTTPDGGGVAAAGQETLTVTDNRTGKTYEVPIDDGTVRVSWPAAATPPPSGVVWVSLTIWCPLSGKGIASAY